jgi:undecaprenyl-diphosphatase
VGEVLRHNSFPSGHTATAFVAVTLLAFMCGGVFYYGYGVAFLVEYSRMYMGGHFPFDVAVGVLLGTSVAVACVWAFRLTKWVPQPVSTRSD